MRMVNIGNMGMFMCERCMLMRVAVLSHRHWVVEMVMVTVFMAMGMLMFHSLMDVLMVM